MIVSFGYICMELQMDISGELAFPCAVKSRNSHLVIGGSATNQAISAARCGAKASLIGTIGNDIFGKTILATLRREGIHSSGIVKSDEPTSIINSITIPNGQQASIIMEGASNNISAKQIPDNLLNEKTLLLLQNDINIETNTDILKRCKKGGAKSIICVSHENNIDKALFDYSDIQIINEQVSYCDNKSTIKVKYTSKAFDAFCGSFAACFQAGLALELSTKYGHVAAQKYMESGSFPYICDIEEDVKNLKA